MQISVFFSIFTGCGDSKSKAVSQMFPMLLQGIPKSEYRNGTNAANLNSPENSVNLLTASNSQNSCTDAAVETPADFGASGPEAFYSTCSADSINRFKNLEIKFSDPMDQTSVQSAFSLICFGSALPGPAPGGTMIWKSPQRLIFDPYRELPSNTDCVLNIADTAQTSEGRNLISFRKQFRTSHDYLISASITQGSTVLNLGGQNDVTFNRSASLIFNASFTNPAGAFSNIRKIVFNRMGNTDASGDPNSNAVTVCDGNCSSLLSPINLNSDPFMTGSMALTDGGNTYYFDITTNQNSRIQRYFSFNYGNLNTNPGAMIQNVASGVLDQTQIMSVLKRLLESFISGKFRLSDAGVPKTFNQFANQPVTGSKNTANCINYGSFSFLKNYGDNSGGGYCGGTGDSSAGFQAVTGAGCFGNARFAMDVYVTSVNIPNSNGGNPTAKAGLTVNADNEVGIDLSATTAVLNLAIVATNLDNLLCLVGAGEKFHFSAQARLNNVSDLTFRLARSKNAMAVDSSGNLTVAIKSPYSPTNTISQNFYVSEWYNNLVVNGISLVSSTNWLTSLLSPITNAIATSLLPQVQPGITQSVLADVIEKIAPNILNSIVASLKNPGVDIAFPAYLPLPLSGYPINAKVQLSTDAAVRNDGTNKGIVASVHGAITSKNPLAPASQRQHSNGTLCSNGCMVYTKDPSVPLIDPSSSAPFSISAANPGFLLALHSDAFTQAAYHLWRNRAIDLTVDSAGITSINQNSGGDPLLQLTNSLLKASAILSIIAPGQNTLTGVDNSGSLLPEICQDDQVSFKIEPIMPPVTKMINNRDFDGTLNTPNMNISVNDLQVTLQGKRTDSSAQCTGLRGAPDSSYYTIAALRMNLNSNLSFTFSETSSFLNALSIRLLTDGMKYSLETLEGTQYNPYGLDPQGIQTVFNPLVQSLIVPLLNSILNRVPLPSQLALNALRYPGAPTVCSISTKTDNSIKFNSLAVPASDAQVNPYILAQATLKGTGLTDPASMLETNCR